MWPKDRRAKGSLQFNTVFYSSEAIDKETLALTYDELSEAQLKQLVAAAGENKFTFHQTS